MAQANTVNNLSSSFARKPCGLPQGGSSVAKVAMEDRMASLASSFARIASEDRSEDSAKMPRGLPRGASSQAHVLLVDDEVSALDISTFILQQNGYAVSMASNGQDALVMLNGSVNSSNPVDLVITDLTMPVMSGMDFIPEIRKRGFSMPVVVTTGCIESYSEPEIKNMGADQILFKPFNPSELTDCVKTMIARKQDEVPTRQRVI